MGLDVGAIYGRCLDLAREAAAGGHYEVAYHALMAGVHAAEDAGDTARLAEAAGRLRECRAAVDALAPPHRLSTRSTHGGRGVFEMGACQAESVVQRLEARRRVDDLRHRG